MFKLSHNCPHLTGWQSNAQNSPSQASAIHEPRTSTCTSQVQKRRQRNQRSNCQHLLDDRKSKRIPEKNIYFCFTEYAKAFYCVDHNKLWKILKEMGIPDLLYAGQEATVRTRHGTMNWFQTGKGVHQGCISSPHLFHLYAEYIMKNARLDEVQAGIKIARTNINNLRYADDTTLMAGSDEELKSLLMKVKRVKKLA